MICPACATDNPAGSRFCGGCGTALSAICAACGTANDPSMRFCNQCGAALAEPAAATQSEVNVPPTTIRPEPAAERRLVSVLFADLVGFTAASEGRDAEETRELLSTYFDLARTLIERYGGTIEKFIGDAVMAVWGTPTATEDDAERAVRAGLDLVAAVPDLHTALRARAGVVTGEAAGTRGAEGQGTVAGDLVNTASRVQAAAEPGTVLVAEATRRASERAIAYEEAGEHELKGKSEPIYLWRALRVTARRGGALKPEGLEPPFVGRERDLRLIKELFHGSAVDRKAHLVSLTGIAGIGKSRLAWEFRKYIDGLVELIAWHHGRCLAYGEGVAYWALAEMVRMRAEIVEGEESAAAREKLRAAVELYVSDLEERSWMEPRLAHLLGLEDLQVHEREDLFAGWRLFFERIAESGPVVMVFEDMHWADTSLLEFVEYLLEWSRNYPIYVITLARPELQERHPSWGAGKRNFTSLSLEPLAPQEMERLLGGLVPGLPEELRGQILSRSEGVPLYAVETVRMLLDRGLLEREGDVYRPTGPVEALEVPESLHALVAARLDGLAPEERRAIQDASVLGKTFTKEALAQLSGIDEQAIEPLLAGLVRKEVLTLQADPRSPERGQYGFLQDLLKRVAYETLAKRDRKLRHLGAATYLERAFGAAEQEVVEVVAAHYRDAYEAAPEDEDAPSIKAKASEALARAGARAASLAAADEAHRYFEQAAALADDPVAEALLHERAGEMALAAVRRDEAQARFERAIELFEAAGQTHPAARVSGRLGEVLWQVGHIDQAIEEMERARAVLAEDQPDADFAALLWQLGRLQSLNGNLDEAGKTLEKALSLAESLLLPELLAQVINSFGVLAIWRGRPEMAMALYTHSLNLALEHELPTPAFRAYNNLADCLYERDRHEEALIQHASGIALARRVGNRAWEWTLLLESTYPLMLLGRWGEVLAAFAEVPDEQLLQMPFTSVSTLAEVEVARGRVAEARRRLATVTETKESVDVQERAMRDAADAVILRAEGRAAEALAVAERFLDNAKLFSSTHQVVKTGFVEAVEAAFALERLDRVDEFLTWVDGLRAGEAAPFVRANASRFHARLSAARGDIAAVEGQYREAEAIFREFGLVFWLAVTLLEHAECLVTQKRAGEAEPMVAEAQATFRRLEAAPWVERVGRIAVTPRESEPVAAGS